MFSLAEINQTKQLDKEQMQDPLLLTAAEIMRDPKRINGLLLPYFEVHLSLQIPTQG